MHLLNEMVHHHYMHLNSNSTDIGGNTGIAYIQVIWLVIFLEHQAERAHIAVALQLPLTQQKMSMSEHDGWMMVLYVPFTS